MGLLLVRNPGAKKRHASKASLLIWVLSGALSTPNRPPDPMTSAAESPIVHAFYLLFSGRIV
jgi:hypothetical protein